MVTIHVDNMEVRKTLEMLSRQANMNILVSPGVTGTITLDLRDLSVDDTLNAIAELCRLKVRRDGNLIYVSTVQEWKLAEEDNLPIRVYRLNYVKSTDIQEMVQKLLSNKGVFTASPDSEIGLTSDASKASEGVSTKAVKAGGNSMAGGEIVIVQDYESVLEKVDRVIAEIDVQPIQVMIEAVIVSVKLEKGMELGVNFGLLDGAQQALAVAGSGTAINAATGFLPAAVVTEAGKVAGTPISGFARDNGGLKFGYVQKDTTGFIHALESLGETKVLACPRLFVVNKQRAEIHLGDRLGYATSTQTQTSTVEKVEFTDVGTQLRLRPFISSDGMIRLEVHPERSSGVIDSAGIPQISGAQVTTNVIVPDGKTLVIGGLIDDEEQDTRDGLPFLSRLPWIGWLFGQTDDKVTKKELIVILTPHIWHPQCPEGLDYLGALRSLGLERRVSQRPRGELRDGPSLYEIPPPGCPYPETGAPPSGMFEVAEPATAARRASRAHIDLVAGTVPIFVSAKTGPSPSPRLDLPLRYASERVHAKRFCLACRRCPGRRCLGILSA